VASPQLAQQITMFVSDYDRLTDERDNAAYRAVGAITAAIRFCRDEQTKDALAVLTAALDRFEMADSNLQKIKSLTRRN
jgi:predicted negative regulator of RcsB-dependent stress response